MIKEHMYFKCGSLFQGNHMLYLN